MKFKTILIVGGAVTIAGVFVLWYLKKQNTSTISKQQMAQYLIANGYTSGDLQQMLAYGTDYITAWYKGAVALQTSFVLNGVSYDIKGGTALQPGQQAV